MALKYSLVNRKDMRKEARPGDTLFYGQTRTNGKISYVELCEEISAVSTASDGDVECVMKGLLRVLKKELVKGNVVQLGEVGNFRMVAGSKGVANEEDFNVSHFKKSRIVFTPGVILTDLRDKVRFEREEFKTVIEECDQEHPM